VRANEKWQTKARKHKFRCRWAPAKSYAKDRARGSFRNESADFVSRLSQASLSQARYHSLSGDLCRAAKVRCSRGKQDLTCETVCVACNAAY